jgi:membrane-associated progesterone receptor component
LDSPQEVAPPPRPQIVTEKRDYSLKEIRDYDGSDPSKPIFIVVKGTIYDVSSRVNFYGKGGPYNIFAGRDAGRALATSSLDEKDVENPSLEGLSADELNTLNEWEQTYASKYPIIGKVID